MSKTRVAPLKKLTLPRLELMAALVGAHLAHFLQNALMKKFPNLQVILWSDSQIVLYWLHSTKQLPQFVHNRVHEITRLFPATCWRYCPTADNPADFLTRGLSASQLQSAPTWLLGPTWLPVEDMWPVCESSTALLVEVPGETPNIPSHKETAEQVPPEPLGTTDEEPRISKVIDLTRHSTLSKLLHVTALVLRFVHNVGHPSDRKDGALTVAELRAAETKWVHDRQLHGFSEEIANISARTNKRTPLARQLRLFLDNKDLLRCGGRIHNAPVTDAAKFPILLPKKDYLTNLIIRDTHARQLHAGVNSTLTALRQTFWVPAGRYEVKKVLNGCVTCKKVNGHPYRAPNAPLLTSLRLKESRPFAVTGVDFTGALYVRDTKGTESKVYICLFTCATTKAVHLEVVSDLSVGTFLLTFRRFVSRRSLPDVMMSDNATTYESAAVELKELYRSIALKKTLSRQGVEWKFIPKRAPWYGGYWERLIGLIKTAIRKVLGRSFIDLITLQTVVVEVEAILNDRPLTYVSPDVGDEEPLTPSHLLCGRRITNLPHPDTETDELTDPSYAPGDGELRRNAARVAVLLQHFWQRWKREYLTSLREFHGTNGSTTGTKVKIGDVVQIHSDERRIKWKLAVVESLIKGSDNQVRAVNLRTANGHTNRPITKLYPLEITADIAPEPEPEDQSNVPEPLNQPVLRRSQRIAAVGARDRIADWARQLRVLPEDI